MFDSCTCCQHHHLSLPDHKTCVYPGNVIVFHRFDTQRWVVDYGWFAFGGNRKICGWYCYQQQDKTKVKPIEDIDLYDIYIVQS